MDAERLIDVERRYAPTVQQGRGVFSPLDRNAHAPWNIGGDKMGRDRHGYADVYAGLLDGLDPQVVVELGVFTGVSMAMWCDLFPEAMVVGLDLEFGRFRGNERALRARGAFTVNFPVLHEWDAFGDDVTFLADLPGIDLFVDDGPHTGDAVGNVLRLVGPLMNPGGVYVVEDFADGGRMLEAAFPGRQVIYGGLLNAVRL